MSAVMTADPRAVNAKASEMAESTKRIVVRCQDASSLYILFAILVCGNWSVRRQLERLRRLVSSLNVENEGDRSSLLQPAQRLGIAARQWDGMHQKWVGEIMPKIPSQIPLIEKLAALIARQLEEITCTTEDLAETLALAASEEFARMVAEELATQSQAVPTKHDTA